MSQPNLEQRIIKSSVTWSNAGMMLAAFLASRFTYRTKEQWCERIALGEIKINGKETTPETILNLHDIIEYIPQDIKEPPADLNYSIIHEDDNVIVVNKPGNLCVHPSGPFFKHTLWHLLTSKYGKIHFVNRLDRETSGILLATKNSKAAAFLSKAGNITCKEYEALVFGNFNAEITATGFLVSDKSSMVLKKRKFVYELSDDDVKVETATTILKPIKSNGNFSLVNATPITGRMHQIRITLYSLGFPMVGDKLYGPNDILFLKQRTDEITQEEKDSLIMARQALHSSKITYIDPQDHTEKTFYCPSNFTLPEK
jgi:23S rRNA pseudouridine955/2504/2580 synthase/23S rRNA pseudouridine1911/1915/1917 synthase